MINSVSELINISGISENDLFKVSKYNYQKSLPLSLKISGMLEIPYIVRTVTGYHVFTCHNRIKILRDSGITSLNCYVLNEPDVNIFMNYVSLKAYRNELGPAGKLKTLTLLKDIFILQDKLKKEFCEKILRLPSGVAEDEKFIEQFFTFPESLILYLDEKDIGFKIIRDLLLLPSDWLGVVDNWVRTMQIRVNVFKMLIDNIYDIYRRGDDLSVIESVICEEDKILYDNIFRIRYPQYIKMKMESDKIIKELTGRGIAIDFPEYFDRKFITVRLDIDKNSDCKNQIKKLLQINSERLNELMSLL